MDGQKENPTLVRTVILKQGQQNMLIVLVNARLTNECIQNRIYCKTIWLSGPQTIWVKPPIDEVGTL